MLQRRAFLRNLIAGAVLGGGVREGATRVARRRRLLGRFVVAGFQYHDGLAVVRRLRPGQKLQLVPEPANRHDPYAVAIITRRGHMLGYVPRTENRAIHRLLSQGEQIVCRITAVRPDAAPWQMVEVEVCWVDRA